MSEQVVVYDGECRFCNWSVRRIQRLDKRGQFECVPRQAQGIELRFPKLADSDFNTGLRLIIEADEIYVGADAVYEIYRRMPPFELLTWLYRVPGLHALFGAAYAFIARNRHRLGRVQCDAEACAVPYGARQAAPNKGAGT